MPAIPMLGGRTGSHWGWQQASLANHWASGLLKNNSLKKGKATEDTQCWPLTITCICSHSQTYITPAPTHTHRHTHTHLREKEKISTSSYISTSPKPVAGSGWGQPCWRVVLNHSIRRHSHYRHSVSLSKDNLLADVRKGHFLNGMIVPYGFQQNILSRWRNELPSEVQLCPLNNNN